MDSTMTTVNQSNNDENVKKIDEEQIHQRTARSVSHGRPPSASSIRTKIPMNINHNRPVTSIVNAQLTSCTQDDTSNSITSGSATRRLTRSHNSALSKSKVQGITQGGMQKRWLESQFKKEKKRYLTMRKELDEKQKCAQKMYDDMSQLREKLIADGIKDPGKIEEIKLNFNHSNKQSGDQNICQGGDKSSFVINAIVNEEFITVIEHELKNYPNDYFIHCEDILKKHFEILKWIEDLGKSNDKFGKDINEHVNNHKKDMLILNEQLEKKKKLLNEFNDELAKKIMIVWNEIDGLRSRIKDLESIDNDALNEMREKLNTEMGKFHEFKERKTLADSELTKSKAKIQIIETRIDADETKIAQLQSYIKNLEDQLTQKDINFEHSTRDLNKSLKHSEEAIVSLESQKENLQLRLNEMNDKLERERRRRLEKSPRIQEMTKRPIENNIGRDRDTKRKVCELETLIETLRDEVTCNKDLIVKLQNEKSSSEMELKKQLANEQAQATKLMENYEQLKKEHKSMQQISKNGDNKMLALCYNDNEIKNNEKDLGPIEFSQLIEDLRKEIADLKRKNRDLETQLQQQIKNLELKNQMITYLKGEHSKENNSDVKQIDKEIDEKAEALQDLYSTLETKQMQLTHLETLLKQMEGQEMRNQEQRTRYEKRIAQLEYDAQMKKTKDCRYVMDFSMPHHSSSKHNEVEKVLELERKYQRLKKESWQMENIYNKLLESTLRSVRSRECIRHSRGSCRDREYACRSSVEPRHVDVGCYVHQVVDQCGRELGDGFNSNGRQKIGCWNHPSHHMTMRRKFSSKRESSGHIHQ